MNTILWLSSHVHLMVRTSLQLVQATKALDNKCVYVQCVSEMLQILNVVTKLNHS